MRPSRPSNLLQRLGLVGAGLAIVAALFAFGGGLVAFGLWPDDLSHNGTQRIVLRIPTAQPAAAAERPRTVAAAPRAAVSSPRPGRDTAVARPVFAPPKAAITIAPKEPLPVRPLPTEPEPTEPAPQPVVPVAPTDPLLPVGEVVGQTTSTLAQTLTAVATALEHGLAGVRDLLGGPDD